MALKSDREIHVTDISCTFNTPAEAGTLAVRVTGASYASGQGINDSAPVASTGGTGVPASGSRVIGLLLDYVVQIDPTRQHRNYQRTEQLVGEPVAILKDGMVWTNKVTGTPAAGDPAYPGPGGTIQNSQANGLPQLGEFKTSKDADGYCKVYVKLA